MRPSTEKSRPRRRRHTAPPTEASKEHHQSEATSIDTGLKLLDLYTSALKDLKERGQDAAGDIKLALDVRHAPRDWSNAEILSVMSDVIDEHPRPKLEFVLGVLGLSKVPDSLDERLRSQGAKAYAIGVRTRALRKKKEAKEKEERERREKKEREEREKREKREKKEKEEKEKREKERIEKEKAEEEKRKAAEKKEAEARRGRGKSRRARRGRPPAHVVATERAKTIDPDEEASAAKALMQVAQGKPQNEAQMDVDADGSKQDASVKKKQKNQPQAETKQKGVTSQSPNVAAGHLDNEKGNVSIKPKPKVSQPSLPEVKTVAPNASATESAEHEANGTPKKEHSLPTGRGKAESKSTTATRRKTAQTEVFDAKQGAQPSKSVEKADTLQKKPKATKAMRDQAKVLDAKHQPEKGATDASGKADAEVQDTKEVEAPVPVPSPSQEAPVTAEQSSVAPPKVIAEAKIASALKESAAAVNGEKSQLNLIPSVVTKAVSDVGETSNIVDVEASGKKEVPIEEEATDEKRAVGSDKKPTGAANDDDKMPEDVTTRSKAAKKPVEAKAANRAQEETLRDTKSADEKDKITDVPEQPAEKSKEQETGAEVAVVESNGEKATDAAKKDETEVMTPKDDSKVTSDTLKEKDDAAKRDETMEKDGEEKEKEPEQEAEDFMADVFGSEDGDGEKDEAEEEDVEKRVLRYRSRGRVSDEDKEEVEAVTTGKGSKIEESEDESQTKEKRKRGRPKGGVRRMSRRVSNIRDEIVVAPAGRRMRRESRNLINGAWQLPVPDQYLVECVEVWERLHANRITIPFREPVAARDAPGYFDVVKKPMDMSTVKDMLQDGRISSPDEFYKLMMLICSNALLFNDEDSDLYELALELRGMIRKDAKPIVKAWREARGLDAEESESESEMENTRKRGKARAQKKSGKAKSKTKSKGSTEKRKRGREDDSGAKSKKRRTLRRSARRDEDD